MKDRTYLLGIVSVVVTTLGGMFKLLHLPGASILLTLGIISLCYIFFPLAFVSAYRNGGNKNVWVYISAFVTGLAIFTGALFKIQHWPGASWFLILGTLCPVVLFLPVYIYHHIREKEESIKNFMYIMFLMVFLSGMSSLLSVNVSKAILDDASAIASLNDLSGYFQLKSLTQKTPATTDPKLIADETDKLIDYIEGLKVELLLRESEENSIAIIDKGLINTWNIRNKDKIERVNRVMLGEGKATQLKNKLEAYSNYLLSVSGDADQAVLIDVRSSVANGREVSWEKSTFENLFLVFTINKLTEIENNVRLAEMDILGHP
jgi:hypothetical protein